MTTEQDRQQAIEQAEAHLLAATRALLSFGFEAVDRLRGELPANWHAADAVNMHRVAPNGEAAQIVGEIDAAVEAARQRIAEAQQVVAEADREVREMQPLRLWLVRTSNAGVDGVPRLEPGADLPVPERHTYFTKPEGTPDPPDWPSPYAEDEGAQLPIDEDADAGTVEMSDQWFIERERSLAKEQ